MDNVGSPETDLTVKYQKLATEYSKLRSNTAVLKKAVSDEQTKCTELREQVKEKDQAVRKLEQEVECLNFRNVQLSKRVHVLQDDLQMKDKSKKNKSKTTTSSALPAETQNILDAELSNRIEENEKLHQQVYSAEVEHKKIVDDLTEQLETMRTEMSRQRETLSETVTKQDAVIKKLTDERAKTEVRIKALEKELGEIREQEHSGMEEMMKNKDELQTKLKTSSTILYEKLPFVDCQVEQFRKYNIHVFIRKNWDRAIKLLEDLGSLVSDFVRKLCDLHTYTEQLVRMSVENSHTSKTLLVHLGDHVNYLKAIDRTYQNLVSQISKDVTVVWTEDFQCTEFIEALFRYVQYLKKLSPYVVLFLESKVAINSNIARVAEAFQKLQMVLCNVVSSFCIFSNWISTLANCSHLKHTYGLQMNLDVVLKHILYAAERLLVNLKEARQHTSAKIAVESQLPTITVEMKTTDECILSCLVSLYNLFEKMLTLVKENTGIFENGSMRPLGNCGPTHRSTIWMKERGSNYLSLTNDDDSPQSIPYLLALENQKSIGNFQEVQENAHQKLTLLETKFSKVEQEKEHWLLEYQLLQAKQRREMGMGDVGDDRGSASMQDTEACVKAHIQKLLCRLQVADSKAVSFESEYRATCQTLHILESEHEAKISLLDEANLNLRGLKETHQATVNNYEDQLATMSEHLANMNEKLSSQKDEIDNLRQLSGRKSKGK